MNQNANQIGYGQTKSVNFTIFTALFLQNNNMEIYSTHNEGKIFIAKRFIRTLKNKIYKYMTSSTKNAFIDKLDDRVNKQNNTFYSTIKMKPIDVKSIKYIKSSK